MPSYHKKKYSRRLKKNIIGGTRRKKLDLEKAREVLEKYNEKMQYKYEGFSYNPPNYNLREQIDKNRGRILRKIKIEDYQKPTCSGVSAPAFKKKKSTSNPVDIEFPITTQCTNCRPYYQLENLKRNNLDKKTVYVIDKDKGWTSPEDGGVWIKTEIDYFTGKEIGAILLDMLSFTSNINLSIWLRDTSDLKTLWNAPVPGKVPGYFVPTLGQMSLFNFSENLLKNYQNGDWSSVIDNVNVKESHMEILKNNITDYENKSPLFKKSLADYKVYINSCVSNVKKIISNNPIETLNGDKIHEYINVVSYPYLQDIVNTLKTGSKSEINEIITHQNLLNKCLKLDRNNIPDKVKQINLTYINPELWFQLFNDWHLLTLIKDGMKEEDKNFIYNLQITNKIRKSISRSQKETHGLTVSQELMVYLHSSCNYLRLLHSKHQNFKNLIKISLLINPHELLIGLVNDQNSTKKVKKKIIQSKKKFYSSLSNPKWWNKKATFKSPYPTM